eukprot:5981916-Pleurochrysis_carterae.AAC.3
MLKRAGRRRPQQITDSSSSDEQSESGESSVNDEREGGMGGKEACVEGNPGPSCSSATITAPAVTAAIGRPRRVRQRVEHFA